MIKKILFSGLCVCLIFSTSFASVLNFGDPSVAYLSPVQEQKLGREMMQKIRASNLYLNDPIVEEYVQHLGKRLRTHDGSPKTKITFFVMRNPTINAFTGPGGYIGVNTGLITYAHSQNELAAVLAHEIAHVTQHHIARMFQEASQAKIPALAGILASIAVGLINPALGAGALSATMAGYQQDMLNFTRADEWEADRMGMKTLYKAGFNPMSMPLLFEQLQQNARLYPEDIPALLQTHPTDTQRIADSINRARLYPKRAYKHSLQFHLIQARVHVDMGEAGPGLIAYFENARHSNNKLTAIANEYGYVLALIKTQKYQQAKQQVDGLLKQYPHKVIFKLAEAGVFIQQQDFNTALPILKQAYNDNPEYYPAAVEYSVILYEAGDYKKAQNMLQNLVWSHRKNFRLYFYLAKAQAKNGDLQDAYRSRATMLELLGQKRRAIQLLKIGLKEPGTNPYGKIQTQAQLRRLEKGLSG